ncbi:MAG TPA: hypothetical protein VFD92_01710 [Candidatus Binatia bacterium]|nr:hypothetical protein [Candidatus Binatia bacterium]
MEPRVTERDVELLLLNEESWVTLGAMLGLRTWMRPEEPLPASLPVAALPSA